MIGNVSSPEYAIETGKCNSHQSHYLRRICLLRQTYPYSLIPALKFLNDGWIRHQLVIQVLPLAALRF